MPDQRWIDRQVAWLTALGFDVQDAQSVVRRADELIPDGEDEATFIPTMRDVFQDPSSGEAIADSRVSWYASPWVDAKHARILDSREDNG